MPDPTTTTIPSRIAECASANDTITISGDAIGHGDVTWGLERERKVWLAEHLEPAAESLVGVDIVPLHSETPVGEVTRAGWDSESETVVYEAEITDAKLAEQVDQGVLEVSIEARHFEDGTHAATGAQTVSDITFTGLALDRTGSAPSNSVQSGPAQSAALTARLSAARIDAVLADQDVDQQAIADELDGPITADHVFLNPNQAVGWGEDNGFDGEIHEMDVDGTTVYLPGDTHDDLLETLGDAAEASEATPDGRDVMKPVETGDVVFWESQGDRPAAGRVVETLDEGRYDTELGGEAVVNAPAALIRLHRPDGDGEWSPTDTMVAKRTDGDTLTVRDGWPELSRTEAAAIEDVSDATRGAEPPVDPADTDDMSNDPNDPDDPDGTDPDEDVTALKARLSDQTDRIDELESELAAAREERDEFEEQAEAVDEAEAAFAAALAEHVPRDAEALQADLSLAQMQDWIDDIDDADVGDAATVETDPDPDVQTGGGNGGQEAQLSAAEQDEKQELEARLADLEGKDNRLAEIEAERIEAELAELTEA